MAPLSRRTCSLAQDEHRLWMHIEGSVRITLSVGITNPFECQRLRRDVIDLECPRWQPLSPDGAGASMTCCCCRCRLPEREKQAQYARHKHDHTPHRANFAVNPAIRERILIYHLCPRAKPPTLCGTCIKT